MDRIMIIGCGGSGKSTLARQLGHILQLPVIHLDKLWWKPGWESVTREEFDVLHQNETEKAYWIIDGNFSRTLPKRLEKCDTVIYLDYNRVVCLWSVFKRVLTNLGKVRPDMGDGCPERFSLEFVQWVWNFNKNNRSKIHELLSNADHAQKYILKNRKQLKCFLRDLSRETGR